MTKLRVVTINGRPVDTLSPGEILLLALKNRPYADLTDQEKLEVRRFLEGEHTSKQLRRFGEMVELKNLRFGQLVVRDWPPAGGLYVTDCDCGAGVQLATREELVDGTVYRCDYCQDSDGNGGENGQ